MNRFLLLFLLAGAAAAHAQSFLLQYYTNDGLPIETDSTATYSAPGGLMVSQEAVGTTGMLLTPHGVSALTTSSAVGDITGLVASLGGSTPKDYISSHSEFQYHVGDAGTKDSFTLTLAAHASALTATLAGIGADAHLVVNWKMIIQEQSTNFLSITYTLPDVTTITNQGTWSATWGQGSGGPPVSFTDVKHGGTQTVVGGASYEYDVTYTLDVPFGTDPDINASLDGNVTVTPVPEVGAVWQMSLFVLPALLFLRRRR